MAGALEGITILDFSTLLPGPMATLFLAEAGAQVIKIERPGQGEDMRAYEPRWGRGSVNFALLNRGKRSLALDLKDKAALESLKPLIGRADVLVEQFRPGVMGRLGLGYDDVKVINPRIIYCSITGYGQDGPYRERAGHDLNYIGDTGLLSLAPGPAENPVVPPALIADIAGGAYPAIMNILLALRARDLGGGGAYIDIAMTDGLFPFSYWAMGMGRASGVWPRPGGERVSGGSPRYQIYPTADGVLLTAAPLEERFWQSFTRAIGLEPEWCDDSKDPQATRARVAEIIRSRTAAEWAPVMAEADCCCSFMKSIEEAMADPHFKARGLFAETITNEEGEEMPAVPVAISPILRARRGEKFGAPALGADNEDLLS